MQPLQDSVVLITGGSQGVGLGIARAFLDEGAAVVTCARSEFETPPAARNDAEIGRTMHVSADIRDDAEIDRLVETTLERFGRLDVLVNNAGGQPPTDTATASPRFLRAIIDLNLTAPLLLAQRAYQVMEKQDTGGCVINISSQASMSKGTGGTLAPYGAAKAGLNHLTRSLGAAWGRKVRVNCVSLGWVETPAMSDLLLTDPERKQGYIEGIPVGRMGTPEEVGRVCVFLTSPEASYINGATLWFDGGGGF
jgi:NAD(P)-dependent dehydrogenase (short-subunit alcohol dehydrogenase family)